MRCAKFVLFAVLFPSVLGCAQTRPAFGNPTNGLEVQIKLSNSGDPLNLARVELFRGEIPFPATYANSRGEVSWVNLSNGSYSVRVTLPGYLPGEESIELMGAGMRHMIVMLHPDPKASGLSNVPTDDPLISARYLAAPEKARKEIEDARKAREKGNCKSAIEHGKKAIEVAPNFALAYVEMGMCELMQGDLNAAEKSFRGAIEQDPKFLYGYIGLSQVETKRERWNDAARALGQANQVASGRAEPFYELAKLQLRTGHLDKAELAAKTALTKDYTRIPDAPFLLARVYLLEGKKEAAIESLQKIANTNSTGEIKERALRSIEMIRAEKSSTSPTK